MAMFRRVSSLTGRWNAREIDVDPARVIIWDVLKLGDAAALVQDAFPDLGDDDREFLLTGVTPEEWDELLGTEDGVPDPAVSGRA